MNKQWKVINNYIMAPNGRIWICWNETKLKGTVLKITDQHITCHLEFPELKCQVTAIYGLNDEKGRERLWKDLEEVNTQEPWILLGDWNTTLFYNEKLIKEGQFDGGNNDFRECVDKLGVADLPYSGQLYTWCNNQQSESRMYCKLDRVMGNGAWFLQMEGCQTRFLDCGISDHSPMIVTVETRKLGPSPFHFLNGWVHHPQYKSIVQEAWDRRLKGTKMFCFIQKCKGLKKPLKTMHRSSYSSLGDRIDNSRRELEMIKRELTVRPFDTDVIHKEKEVNKQLRGLLQMEADSIKQKAKVEFIQKSDENSKSLLDLKKGGPKTRLLVFRPGMAGYLLTLRKFRRRSCNFIWNSLVRARGSQVLSMNKLSSRG